MTRHYFTNWERFTRLKQTRDSLARERRGFRRWLLMPYVALIIPIEDQAARAQLIRWRDALRTWMPYVPQPEEHLHITLHHIGKLRDPGWLVLPDTWRNKTLVDLADRLRGPAEAVPAFSVKIGPLNAFANALFAEVQDDDNCLRHLRVTMLKSLPLRARPVARWPFLPHITLGYWGRQAAAPIIDAIRSFRDAEPILCQINTLRFTVYTRDNTPQSPDVLVTAQENILAEYSFSTS